MVEVIYRITKARAMINLAKSSIAALLAKVLGQNWFTGRYF